jgi:predicted acetyltransferase
MALEIRAVALDELDGILQVDARGFGMPPYPPDGSRSWAEGELDRTRVAFDGDEMVGVSRAYSFELTLPGGAYLPAAAVSWVAVLSTHRRRGVLTKMIGALHDDARAREEPVAILTASESNIYGRYGYGVATWRLGMTSERARVEFRPGVGEQGRMRMVTREEGDKVLPAIYEQARPLRAGMVSRPDFWWPTVFWEQFAGKDKAFFVAVHTNDAGVDDGFVAYQIEGGWGGGLPDRDLLIWDMQSTHPDATAALWRYAYGVDLVGTVRATNVPIDSALRHLVVDGRRVRVDFVNDQLWCNPLDPAPLLASRRYATEGRLVFELHAPDGTRHALALEGGTDGAQCTPTTDTPDIVCSTATLGACALGGNRWSELAEAGMVNARAVHVLHRADLMFTATPAPALLSAF